MDERDETRPLDGLDSNRIATRLAAHVLVLNVLLSAAAGGQAVVTARTLGPSGRGALVLYLLLASFVALLCAIGTNTAARYLLLREDPRDRVTLGDFLGLSAVLSLVAVLVATAASVVLLPIAGLHITAGTALLVGTFAGLLLLGGQVTDALHAFGRHVAASWCATGPAVAALLLTVVVAASSNASAQYFLGVLAVSVLGQVLLAFGLLHSHGPRVTRADGPAWGRLLRLGVPGVGLALGQSLTFRIDRYLVGVFLTPAAVGAYSVAATVPEILRLIPYSVSQIVFRQSAVDPSYSWRRYPRHRAAVVALVAGAAVVAGVSAPWVIPAVFGEEFRSAVAPLEILLVAELAISRFYMDSRCLTGVGLVRPAAVASVVGLVVVVVADVVLIPTAGLNGAAFASVLAYAAMAFLTSRTLAGIRPAAS
jgi:O-antigen/teichoic acid export membrane protein